MPVSRPLHVGNGTLRRKPVCHRTVARAPAALLPSERMNANPPAASPLLELKGISKRFTSRLDLASRIAARLGSSAREQTVHALDGVDLGVAAGAVSYTHLTLPTSDLV